MAQRSVREANARSEWGIRSNQNRSGELYHYGILGMKWGVRRTPEQLGHKSASTSNSSKSNSGSGGGGGSSMTEEELLESFKKKADRDDRLRELHQKGKETADRIIKKLTKLAKDVGQKAKDTMDNLIQSGKNWIKKTFKDPKMKKKIKENTRSAASIGTEKAVEEIKKYAKNKRK